MFIKDAISHDFRFIGRAELLSPKKTALLAYFSLARFNYYIDVEGCTVYDDCWCIAKAFSIAWT